MQTIFTTRTSVDQHKCLSLHECINPTPLLFEKIIVNSKKDLEILKKSIILKNCSYSNPLTM